MLRSWQVFGAEPEGASGMPPRSARTVELTCQAVLELHPGARVSAIDTDQLVPKRMPSLMVDWLRGWEDDFTP